MVLHGNKDARIKIDFDSLTEGWLETQSCLPFFFSFLMEGLPERKKSANLSINSQEKKNCFCHQNIICVIKWQKSISVLKIRYSHTPSLFLWSVVRISLPPWLNGDGK